MNIKTGLSQWLDLIKNHITEATTTVTMLAGVLIGVTGVSSLPQTTSLLLVVVSTILLPGKWWPHITQQADLLLIKPTSQPLNFWQRLMDPFQATARKSYKLPLHNRRLEGLLLLIIFLGTSAFSLSRAPGVKAEIFPSSWPGEITACNGDGSRQALLIVVADFDEQATSLNLEDNIFRQLSSESQWLGRIRVCKTSAIITNQPEAIELGKDAKAAIVIWGQSDEALYEVNIEVAEWDMPDYEWRPFPTTDAKSPEFQMNEPAKTSFLAEFALSHVLYLRGDTDGALEFLSNALLSENVDEIKQNPGNLKDLANAFFLLGYLSEPDFDSAVKYYSEAKSLDPEIYPAYINLGIAYQEIGQIQLAMEIYEEVVYLTKDKEPDTAAIALINLAWLKAGEDQTAAEEYFSRAINLAPAKGYSQRGLARLFRWNQTEAAIADFSEAVKLESTDPYLYHFLGKAQLINNQPDDAIQTYEKAISVARWEPDDRDTMIDELRLLAKGVSPESEAAIEKIIEELLTAIQ